MLVIQAKSREPAMKFVGIGFFRFWFSGKPCFQGRPIQYFTNPSPLSHCRVRSQDPSSQSRHPPSLRGIRSRSLELVISPLFVLELIISQYEGTQNTILYAQQNSNALDREIIRIDGICEKQAMHWTYKSHVMRSEESMNQRERDNSNVGAIHWLIS